MPLNPSGAISLAGPVAGQSIAVELGQSATATISLNDTNVRTLAQKPSGVIVMPTDFWGKSNVTGAQRAIFAFGQVGPASVSITNLVSNTGVVAADTPTVANTKSRLSGSNYGGDKAIFAYGQIGTSSRNTSNLISNTGVMAADTPGVGTARFDLASATYGGDKAIFGYGQTAPTSSTVTNVSNLVSNTGVVSSDTPGVGTSRARLAAVTYGGDKGLFGYGSVATTPPGQPSPRVSILNYVTNTGVVASDTPGVDPRRFELAGANYGGDKALFAYGSVPPAVTTINYVSNTGVVSAQTSGTGTGRQLLAGAGYGGDKAIFGYGNLNAPLGNTNITNLISNTGVMAADTPGVGSARQRLGAASYSFT
jgi:hypothetical protein